MEIRDIENIEPKEVMTWFKKICAIPHGSYHEEKISKWLAEQCKKAGCEVKVYPSGMILAKQKASKGCEEWPIVLLQSHMDMVLAKTDKYEKDLTKEPIDPYYDTETAQVKASHTSLGGDDGIGVASQLAIMYDKKIKHGPIEHLFTVNEEDQPGLCLKDMKMGELKAKYYLNLDGEVFSELTFGGAGCSTMKYDCPLPTVENKQKKIAYRVSLTGLTGGHSGVNVHRPHINAISFISQCIIDFEELNKIKVCMSKFDGGPISNSLPIFAKVDLLMEPKQWEKFKRFSISQLIIAKRVAQKLEENAVLSFDTLEAPKEYYSEEISRKILLFASLAPNKIFTLTNNEQKMFSSSNLGFVCIDNGKMQMDFKVRSFIDGETQRIVRKIKCLGELLGFKKFHQQGQLFAFINDVKFNTAAQTWAKCYKEVTGEDIKFLTIAGGLECATICVKNPAMVANTISVNTSLFNCHSPYEAFSVADTVKFWKVLKMVLGELKE